jgi:hypothetical protein
VSHPARGGASGEFHRIDIHAYEQTAERQLGREIDIGLGQFSAHCEHHVRVGYQLLNGTVGQRSAEACGMTFGEHALARRCRHQGAIQRFDQAVQLRSRAARAAAGDDEGPRGNAKQSHGGVDLIGTRLRQRRGGFESIGLKRRVLGEDIERNFQIRRAWTSGAQGGQTQSQVIAHILGALRRTRDAEYAGGERGLVAEFVQHSPLFGE